MPYPVTQDFMDKMRAAERQTFGKVQIDYTDVFLDQSIQAAVNERANASYPAQTADSLSTPFAKIMSLDGSCKLDGTYALAPNPAEAVIHQMGWWGKQLAGTGGAFATPYPALTVTHQLRPVHSLKVVGDNARQEYPVDFEVRLYAADNTLLKTETVTANAQVSWSKTLSSPVLDVAKQVLTITKWSHAGRQAKIIEFFTSIQETYEGADIISVSLLEEREVSQGSLPVGSISANEIDVRLDNSSRKFDAGNTSSPLRNLVKANRRIKAWLGVEAENMQSTRPATFSRASTAYNPETGAQVASGVPRFVTGRHGKAVLVEEGTANKYNAAQSQGQEWGSFEGSTITLTQGQADPLGGTSAARVQTSGGTNILKAVLAAGVPGNGVMWSGQIWIRNRSTATVTVFSNQGGQFQEVTQAQGWVQVKWTITGDAYGEAQHQLRVPTASDNLDCDVAFLQYEEKPYCTSWQIGGTARAGERLSVPTVGVMQGLSAWAIELCGKALSITCPQVWLEGRWSPGIPVLYGIDSNRGNELVVWYIDGNGTNTSWFTGYKVAVPTEWHQYALVYDSVAQSMRTYVDGQQWAERSGVTLQTNSGTNPFYVAFDWGTTPYEQEVVVDDLRISSRARTDAEILAAYQSGEPLPVDEWTTYKLTFNGSVYPVEMCWVPMGTFWSGDWSAPEDEVHAATTGRDRLEALRKSTYSTSQVATNTNLYNLAVAVLQDAGLKAAEYWVDTELQQYGIPYAYFEPQSHREALRKIAEACLGQVYCDRGGVVRVEGPSYLASKTTSDFTLTEDDYFRKDNPARYTEIANYVEVETQPLRPDTLQEVYRSNEPVAIGAGQTVTQTVFYNNPPCIEAAGSLSGQPAGCSITAVTYYAWGAAVTVSNGSTAGTFTLVIQAKPLKVLNKERAVAKDDNSITDNGRLKYTFPQNPLVQTLTVAQTIANALLASYKNPRRDAELDWRGNPAVLLGDRVTVVDRNEANDYYVTRQELEFDGALSGRKLSGRRVI